MSIEQSYRRITFNELSRLLSDPLWALSFLGKNSEDIDAMVEHLHALQFDDRYLNIGKDWHAIHFLLTAEHELSESYQATTPLHKVVMGGTKTPYEAAYDYVRYLTPEEVKEITEALSLIEEEDLRSRAGVEKFNVLKIYPNPRPGGWSDDDLEDIFVSYEQVVKFFAEAADKGEAILLSSD